MDQLANLIHPAVSVAGFILSACALAYALRWTMTLLGYWPSEDRRTSPQNRMQGGCAKHNWAGTHR